MSELENYDQDRLFKNFFFKYRFHLITSILVIALLVIVGRNLYLKTNIANTTSLYNFNKIISDFAIDSASENLYSDLKEFLKIIVNIVNILIIFLQCFHILILREVILK